MTLNPNVIGLSVTHPSNKYHGYTGKKSSQTPNIVEIESVHVKSHRIL